MEKTTRWALLLFPMLAFTVTYLTTGLLGAVALLLNWKPFVQLFEYYSGTRRPPLGGKTLQIALLLLFVAPAIMWLGYLVTCRVLNPRAATTSGRSHSSVPLWVPCTVFSVCALVATASIIRASSLNSLGDWFNFSAWVHARWRTFGTLTFFEFVNIYLILPFSAAWVALEGSSIRKPGKLLRWAPAVIAVGLEIPLFQKKAAVVSIVIVGCAYLLRAVFLGQRVRRLIFAGTALGLGIYFAMVVVPTFSTAKNELATAQVEAIAAYAMLAPITRTSAPALYYPLVFPAQHPYYGIDLGQDILCSRKIGCHGLHMPNDNIVVWNAMNPTFHGGAVAAPFQFVLYSQIGLIGSLIGALLVGAVIAMAWVTVLQHRGNSTNGALWGTVVVLLAIYLAIDSLRNSVLVSYGVLWPSVFLALVSAVSIRLSRRTERSSRVPSKGPAGMARTPAN